LADDKNPTAGIGGTEEKGPIFSTGAGAFDRAGYNEAITKGAAATIKDEDTEKRKTADKVQEEAQKYYNAKYEESIKKIDPAYDSKSVEASVAELTYNRNLREIKKNIDEGKPLEGVKDILPLAEESAENRISLTKSLKTGTTTQIAEKVGISNIKEMKAFDEVSEDFDAATKNEKLTLEESLSSLSRILSFFNNEIRDANVAAKMFTPQNNATISAIARILEKEGFSSEIVKTMSKRFEENLAKFAEKEGGKIEGAMPTPGATGAATGATTGATTSTAPQKVEEKIEGKGATGATGAAGTPPSTEPQKLGEKTEPEKTEGTTGAVVATAPQKVEDKSGDKKSVEGAKEPTTPKDTGAKSEPPKNNRGVDFVKGLGLDISDDKGKKQTTETGKQELSSKEGEKPKEGVSTKDDNKKADEKASATTEKGEQKIEGSKSGDSRADFIKSMFGGLIDEKGGSLESSKEDLKKDVTKGAESKMESTKAQVSEKIQKKAETIPGGGAIKETTSQKLATPSVATSTKAENATAGEESSESTASTTSQEATTASSATGGGTEEAKGATSENKGEGGGGLEAKMDSMIGLLSQLNATLQGPLLTISSSKKFD